MGINAILPSGMTEVIVNGLHQWDYGRKLEIHSDDLPALIEVHFACAEMKEAVVRSSAVINGKAVVAIPDQCLEQSAPIKAWVYEVGETTGATIKTITLIVTPRAKPHSTEGVPETFSDKYTELVGAINEQVEALHAGNVTVGKAIKADSATNAENANNASNASYASTAGNAQTANKPASGGSFITSEGSFAWNGWIENPETIPPGVHMVVDTKIGSPPLIIDTDVQFSPPYLGLVSGTGALYCLEVLKRGEDIYLNRRWKLSVNDLSWGVESDSGAPTVGIKYRTISYHPVG